MELNIPKRIQFANNQAQKINVWVVKTIENIVVSYMKANGIKKVLLADKLHDSPQNVGKKLNKPSLDSAFIELCCEALNHDFFADLSKEFQTNAGA